MARLDETTNVVIGLIHGWQKDIRNAMTNYHVANAQILRSSLLPDTAKDRKPMWDILTQWMECDLPRIAGAGFATNVPCEIKQQVTLVQDAWKAFERALAGLTVPTEKLATEAEKIRLDIDRGVKNETFRLFKKHLVEDRSLRQLLDVLDQEPTRDALRAAFERTPPGTPLLRISDIAERVELDARVITTGKTRVFSTTEFAPFANAVTLAKVTLLDAAGLNDLARKLGVSGPTEYGQTLYPSKSAGDEEWNVLRFVARSIDHNHQWHADPPPYARTKKPFAPAAVATYVRDDRHPDVGLRLWASEAAREKIFLKLFRGPLAPALDSPTMIKPGLPDVLPQTYDYRTCAANPFPTVYAKSGCE